MLKISAILILLDSWQAFTGWLDRHMFTCPSVKYLHLQCPGCGLQRSILALLRGDIVASVQLYPALIPFLVLAVYTILHLRKNYPQGARNIRLMQVTVVGIVVVHYIYKINNHQIFV